MAAARGYARKQRLDNGPEMVSVTLADSDFMSTRVSINSSASNRFACAVSQGPTNLVSNSRSSLMNGDCGRKSNRSSQFDLLNRVPNHDVVRSRVGTPLLATHIVI